jgi:1,4-dihydroxy-2-naphthoyl-CoA hydrolase
MPSLFMTSIWKTEIDLDIVNHRSKGTLCEYLNIRFIELGNNSLIASMPINDIVKQPLGIMHGGASCILAESVGSTAGNFCVNLKDFYCVGLDINTNHIKAIRSGIVFAKATPLHLGRSTQVWHIPIENEQKQLISISRLTLAVIDRKKSRKE